ncbi:hypothetical protein PIB30_090977 [Stylosanthes scabra]|uniref:Uncharacterized protein n=1 Tax=Stylosanthes scabra TaxID=79078 RepID=A0ABU6SUX4_9FABA|nr:hypothetical protein [Stylosanthes scabra]
MRIHAARLAPLAGYGAYEVVRRLRWSPRTFRPVHGSVRRGAGPFGVTNGGGPRLGRQRDYYPCGVWQRPVVGGLTGMTESAGGLCYPRSRSLVVSVGAVDSGQVLIRHRSCLPWTRMMRRHEVSVVSTKETTAPSLPTHCNGLQVIW